MRSLIVALVLGMFVGSVFAQPSPNSGSRRPTERLRVQGVVPDQATKSSILRKLNEVYGNDYVIDEYIEVRAVSTPPNWDRYVGNMVNSRLRDVSGGKLEVDGQMVQISGTVREDLIKQKVGNMLDAASNNTYTLKNNLVIAEGPSAQDRINELLLTKTVEFETGSSQLTPLGMRILDEVIAIIKDSASESHIQIIGHTDNVGSRASNLSLSLARAQSVRTYMTQRGIALSRLSVDGKGFDVPIASNDTPEGRARNRRIAFNVL